MRLMTILGTRPEIIRLSLIIPLLDKHCEHILLHTGQNYDDRLNNIFFSGLAIRAPDIFLNIVGDSAADQVGQIIYKVDREIAMASPDAVLVLGDTNSALSAFVAKRRGVRVFHMEAGNRCFDDRVPEEVNRRVIDHSSDVLMPYTERSRANLIAEGIHSSRIFVTGNPIYEVILRYNKNSPLPKIKGLGKRFLLLTAHRAENVDDPNRLNNILTGASLSAESLNVQVVFSLHPRTRSKIEKFCIPVPRNVILCQPFGFAQFLTLERKAICVLTDSGTVQEECCILCRPNVTIRDTTERPETVEAGSNIVCGIERDDICHAVRLALESKTTWEPPPEYKRKNVSDTVVKIVTGYYQKGHYEQDHN